MHRSTEMYSTELIVTCSSHQGICSFFANDLHSSVNCPTVFDRFTGRHHHASSDCINWVCHQLRRHCYHCAHKTITATHYYIAFFFFFFSNNAHILLRVMSLIRQKFTHRANLMRHVNHCMHYSSHPQQCFQPKYVQ